jgi:hypothetical protein
MKLEVLRPVVVEYLQCSVRDDIAVQTAPVWRDRLSNMQLLGRRLVVGGTCRALFVRSTCALSRVSRSSGSFPDG